MPEQIPTWLGITSLALCAALAVFVVLAFRKGMQVKRPAEGVPPERFFGG